MHTTTYAMLPDVSETLRLLADSMDFVNEDGNGWEILRFLCQHSKEGHGEPKAKVDLLLCMLRLLAYEIKLYGMERHFATMLEWTLNQEPGLAEVSQLLFRLGGPESIDTPVAYIGGYTILHIVVAYAESKEDMSMVLAQGPDIHRLGLEHEYSPEDESPFSLALYSFRAFADLLDGLRTIGMDFEEFVTQELERNYSIHPGWEKETLLNVFTYGYQADFSIPRRKRTCSDCTKDMDIRVQPYWRHLLERIKQGVDPHVSAQANSEVDEEEIAESGSNLNSPASLDIIRPEMELDSEVDPDSEMKPESDSKSESELGWELEEGPHDYPSTISIRSDCVYYEDEVVCMNCWLFYVWTGTRARPAEEEVFFDSLECA